MKKATVLTVGFLGLLASSAASGVPSPSAPLDRYASDSRALAGQRGRQPIRVPTSPIEVDIALKSLGEEQQKLEAEQSVVDKDLATVESRILARGRTYYKQVRAGLLPAGGGFQELVDYAARVERTRLSLTRDLDEAKKLRARRDEIADALVHIASDRAPLEAQKKAFDAAKTYMRQANERKAAFDRAFESSTPPPDPVAVYGADLGPADASSTGGFAALRGKLPFPITGRSEVRKIEASGASGPALELRAPSGATARAVAPGRVAFADRYEDDRITVIIDHGDRYFSLYRNLEAVEVKAGETVKAGAALGPVATQGGRAVLYFEIQKEARTIEPGPWLGL